MRRFELDLVQERVQPYIIDMSKALPDIERSTLVARLVESLSITKSTVQIHIKRLIYRGLLLVDGDRVVSPRLSSEGGDSNTCNSVTLVTGV